jgi:hypothetical protein
MAKAAKTIDFDRMLACAAAPSVDQSKAAEADVLHFLSRTLQAHVLNSEPHHMLAKLHNLKTALDQQEITLSSWPDSPSKERICSALAKARNLVAQIVDQFASVAPQPADMRSAKTL